jgi:uncharacterized protein (DUF2235 family)
MRKIVVLSDGTGNSAAKLFRTNVWRLYQLLDQSDGDQLALYDDGVGTSKFKPLAILGGAVGWGLKRNILTLYTFICRNYRPGDQLYFFGFSRGAFTVRVLVNFILSEGLICDFASQDELRTQAKFVYRRFRSRRTTGFRLEILGRAIRDISLYIWSLITRLSLHRPVRTVAISNIKFVGVWDTVDAYGLPIFELKYGIDKYLWPLALEDRDLAPEIEKACHALSIDDKRRTFHPLLWDEANQDLHPALEHTDKERLTQVWFTGVHANVGGGYPDDGLSGIPLAWMLREGSKQGLRFHSFSAWQALESSSPFGRLYDSRGGLGAYYRYEPRRLDQSDNQGARIPRPKVHESVIWRMAVGADSYAPLGFPRELRVVGDLPASDKKPLEQQNVFSFEEYCEKFNSALGRGGSHAPALSSPIDLKTPTDETLSLMWDTVWWRRVVYFLTLFFAVTLVVFPADPYAAVFYQGTVTLAFKAITWPVASVLPNWFSWSDFQYASDAVTSGVVNLAKSALPSATKPWIDAAEIFPSPFLFLVLSLFGCWLIGSLLDRRIHDRALAAWNPRWRETRSLWFQNSRRSRIASAIIFSIVLTSLFWQFVRFVADTECYVNSSSFFSCARWLLKDILPGADTSGFLSHLIWALRINTIAFCISILAMMLWVIYQVGLIRRGQDTGGETPGFALWVSNGLRSSKWLNVTYQFLVRQLVPLMFALSVIYLVFAAANRLSYAFFDSIGFYCQSANVGTPVDPEENQATVGSTTTTVVHLRLDRFCQNTGIMLLGPDRYELKAHFDKQSDDTYVSTTLPSLAYDLLIPFRRDMTAPWFSLIAKIGNRGNKQVVLENGEATIAMEGRSELFLYANDIALGLPVQHNYLYSRNRGTIEITIVRIPFKNNP